MVSFHIKTEDNRILYTEYYGNSSSDKTFIYIHGGPGNGCFDFSYAADKLSKKYNVISFDQRGTMRSSTVENDENFSSDILIDDIECIRKFFKIEKASLIAHSYGGELAVRYFLKYGKSVSDIIFVCPSFNLLDSMNNVYKISMERLEPYKDIKTLSFLREIFNKNDIHSYLEGFSEIPQEIRNEIYGDENMPKEVSDFIFDTEISKEDFLKSESHQKKIFNEKNVGKNYISYTKEIYVPMLLIVGDNDPVCTNRQQKGFLDNAEKGTLSILKNCGHFPYLYNVNDFVDKIIEFTEIKQQ